MSLAREGRGGGAGELGEIFTSSDPERARRRTGASSAIVSHKITAAGMAGIGGNIFEIVNQIFSR